MPLRELCSLRGHEDRVWSADWHPRGDMIASCSGDRTVRVWQRFDSAGDSSWVLVATLSGDHQRTVRSVAWSPDGKLLACASFDATVTIYARDGEGRFAVQATLEGHENEVKSVAWDNEGRLLATCSRDKSAWVWERSPEGEFEMAALLHGHQQDVKHVVWHPLRQVLYSASYDDTIREWQEEAGNADEWVCTTILSGHGSTVWALAFEKFPAHEDEDGTRDRGNPRLVSCSDDTTLIVWQARGESEKTRKWHQACTLTGYHSRAVYSVDWSPTNCIASAGGDDRINVFVEESCGRGGGTTSWVRCCTAEKAHTADVNCVRWNPDFERHSNVLLSCGDDGLVKIWRFEP
eukprot:GGOE01001189.1.p2 GENE.GGOE01001189.1~~GGOE01001189.1.p2  ORF type:complete len:349 (+),score=84.00 GGOE01001189.1:67-1113(+)